MKLTFGEIERRAYIEGVAVGLIEALDQVNA